MSGKIVSVGGIVSVNWNGFSNILEILTGNVVEVFTWFNLEKRRVIMFSAALS